MKVPTVVKSFVRVGNQKLQQFYKSPLVQKVAQPIGQRLSFVSEKIIEKTPQPIQDFVDNRVKQFNKLPRWGKAAALGGIAIAPLALTTLGQIGYRVWEINGAPKPAEQLVDVKVKCSKSKGQVEPETLEITREINQGSAMAKSVTKKAFTLTKNFSEGRRGTGCNQIAYGYNASNETIKNYPPQQRAGVVPIMSADWTTSPGALFVRPMSTEDFMQLNDWIPQAGSELTETKDQTVLFPLDPKKTDKDSKKENSVKRENARNTFGAINRFVVTGK